MHAYRFVGKLQPPAEVTSLGPGHLIPLHVNGPEEPVPPQQVHAVRANRRCRLRRGLQVSKEHCRRYYELSVRVEELVRLVSFAGRFQAPYLRHDEGRHAAQSFSILHAPANASALNRSLSCGNIDTSSVNTPQLPVPACQTKTGGHPEKWPRREIVDGIRYIVDNGAKWRALPADFPPWETVYGFFWRWNRADVVTYIRDQLRRRIRTGKGRCPHPVTLIVDSQSVKGASTVGRNSRGYDAAKKINGRKRHITVDTLGLPVMITVTPADIQDRDAARDVFWRLRLTQPQITQVWADRGYAGELVDWARERLWLTLRIVSRPKGTKGFVVLPRRWKVERTIGWCMNARRNARDYERLPQHSEAHLNWALITMMTRRLTRKSPRTSSWTKKPAR